MPTLRDRVPLREAGAGDRERPQTVDVAQRPLRHVWRDRPRGHGPAFWAARILGLQATRACTAS